MARLKWLGNNLSTAAKFSTLKKMPHGHCQGDQMSSCKICQNVTKPIFANLTIYNIDIFPWRKSSQTFGYFCHLKTPKENNIPIGENSPNLVTLTLPTSDIYV
jgi:hypothetical protein